MQFGWAMIDGSADRHITDKAAPTLTLCHGVGTPVPLSQSHGFTCKRCLEVYRAKTKAILEPSVGGMTGGAMMVVGE